MSESGHGAGPIGPTASLGMAPWMQEIVPFGIFTTDASLRIESWNHWLISQSGLTAEAVRGRLISEVFPALGGRRLLERYEKALVGEVSVISAALHKFLLPFPVTVPESGQAHMQQTARIAPIPDGDLIVGTITIIEDVTLREFQASILSRQQELDRLLSQALGTLLTSAAPVQDMEGIFSTVRIALGLDAYASYLLTPDKRSLVLNGSVGITPKHRDLLLNLPVGADEDRALSEAGSLGKPVTVDNYAELFRRVGIRGQCSLPLCVGNRIIGLVVFASYERDAVSPVDSGVLARIARYVAISIDRERRERETLRASHAKDEFLAALSHELRTPLNPVLLMASDGALNTEYSDEVRESFRMIESNALLEARLIDDLLDMTRISHGKLGLDLRRLDIVSTLRDALSTVRPDMEVEKQVLSLDLADEKLIVLGDFGRLQQVFWNVLKNAVKFTPPDGQIIVSCSANAARTQVTIAISDTGVGMETIEIDRLFEPFSQGDHAAHGQAQRFGGLGLGLAISRRLVELHGGSIEAASEGKGCGSMFTMVFPLASEQKESGAGQIQRDRKEPRKVAALRILLVEDHGPTRQTLATLLGRRGHGVVAVDTARGALNAAVLQKFDVVLSDIGLPDGDGFSLMRELGGVHGMKGIALTGYGMETDVAKSRDAGFLAHITKPVSMDDLDRVLVSKFGLTAG